MGVFAWDEPTSYLFFHATNDAGFDDVGADVLVSKDGGNSYAKVGVQKKASILGVAETALGGSSSTKVGVWDDLSTVDVQIFGDHAPQSHTKCEVLTHNYNVVAIVTGASTLEILAFANAVEVGSGDQVYKLSTLYRGMRNTEDEISNHSVGDAVYFLDPDRVFTMRWELSEVCNIEYFFKTAAVGEDPNDIAEIAFTPDRSSLRPFPVTDIAGVREANDDVTITWSYVTRAPNYKILGCEPMRFLEKNDGPSDTDAYIAQIMDGAAVKRAFAGSAPTATYTEAQQIADWGDEQDTYTVRVLTLSEMWNGTIPFRETTITVAPAAT